MSETQYIKGTPRLRNDILDFGNYVFSNAHRPHDFRALLPKTYGEDVVGYEDYHYLAVRDDRIRGMIAMRPVSLGVLDTVLDCGFIGTVSVHPYARGEGHMKKLMAMATADAQEKYDMMILGGQRQRYNYFGFENGGFLMRYEVNHVNLRHAARDVDAGGITFAPVSEDSAAELDYIHALQQKKAIHGIRPRQELMAILRSWQNDCHVILREGRMVGYMVGSGAELGLEDESELLAVLKAWFAFRGVDSVSLAVAPFERERMAAVSAFCERGSVSYNEMIRILNWPKVLDALLRLKAAICPLQDGRAALAIDGGTPVVITVQGGVPTVTVEDVPADVQLTGMEAQRRFFALESLFTQDPLLKNWAPLPFAMSSVDGF